MERSGDKEAGHLEPEGEDVPGEKEHTSLRFSHHFRAVKLNSLTCEH